MWNKNKQKTTLPDFEKIHPDIHYDNTYYNPDMDVYVHFSDIAASYQKVAQSNIMDDLSDIADFPSAYFQPSQIKSMSRSPLDGIMGFLGGEMIFRTRTLPQAGISLSKVKGSRSTPKKLIMELTDLYIKQQEGLVSLENGDIATRPELDTKWDFVENNLTSSGLRGDEGLMKLKSLAM